MYAKIRDYYAEEVEFLTSCGESPRVILQRLNVTAVALNRALHREGRHDLARLFGSREFIPRDRAKRGRCMDCQTPVYEANSRCRPCSDRHRYHSHKEAS
jgi:hypothetical protein